MRQQQLTLEFVLGNNFAAIRSQCVDVDASDVESFLVDPATLGAAFAKAGEQCVSAIRTEIDRSLCAEMNDAAARISPKRMSLANRTDILNVIEAGRVNADETIVMEHAAPASDWPAIFRGSCASMLSCELYDHCVVRFFAAYDIVA